MPKFRGPINLLLGFDEKTGAPEVVSGYDSKGHNYVVSLSAAAKKKWESALKEHGFSEEQDDTKSEDSDAKE